MASSHHRTSLKASFNVARHMYWEMRLGVQTHNSAGEGVLGDAFLNQLDRCKDDDVRRLLVRFLVRPKREKREPKPKAVSPPKPMKRTVKIARMLELAKRVA